MGARLHLWDLVRDLVGGCEGRGQRLGRGRRLGNALGSLHRVVLLRVDCELLLHALLLLLLLGCLLFGLLVGLLAHVRLRLLLQRLLRFLDRCRRLVERVSHLLVVGLERVEALHREGQLLLPLLTRG